MGRPDPDRRYIVSADISTVPSGLGCCLFTLAPCWKYALKTGRTLVIDWRGNPYTRNDPQKNLFPLLFEQPDPSEIGVSCIADDSVNDLQLPQPILGPNESILHESGVMEALPTGGLNERIMRKIIGGCNDVPFPTVMPRLLTPYILASRYGPLGSCGPFAFSFTEARRLYRGLKLKPQWADTVSEFYEKHLRDRPVIGLHIRHGNGEEMSRRHFKGRVIDDPHRFTQHLAEKIHHFALSKFGRNFTLFLCTDSNDVVETLESCFRWFVSRPIWRPATGEGVDFDHAYKRSDGGIGAAADALIDMQLLAKCDIIFMARFTAFASHVPYVLEKENALFLDHRQTARTLKLEI
jgi:hypothetical protein